MDVSRTPNDLTEFEGLIYSTAARYAPILDDDMEDVMQVLRIKVWRARVAYDPARCNTSEKNFVFSCVRNQVKDLLKAQNRRNDARNGTQLFIEDMTAPRFEGRYLGQSEEETFQFIVNGDLRLPSTLSRLERAVVSLLFLDFTQAEICRRLGVSRQRVRHAHLSVREKMADWAPPALPAELPTQVGGTILV